VARGARGEPDEVLRAFGVHLELATAHDFRYYPSQANFVLVHVGERSTEVRDKLRAVSVLVRDRSYEIAGCVRVTVGNAEQVERFFAELEKIW